MSLFNLHPAALAAFIAFAGTAAAAPLRVRQERQHGPAAGAAGVALRGEAPVRPPAAQRTATSARRTVSDAALVLRRSTIRTRSKFILALSLSILSLLLVM